MDVMILSEHGMPLKCDTEGCWSNATSAWSATVMAGGAIGTRHYACNEHNPMSFYTTPLPFGFRSQPLCHACGQPARFTVT